MARRKLTLGWLNNVTISINSFQDIGSLLKSIMTAARDFLETEAASLMLYEPVTNELVFDIVCGENGELLHSKRMSVDDGIAGLCARNKESIVVNDAANDSRVIKTFDANVDFEVRNLIAIPMVVRNKLIGVIEALNSENRSTFTSRDERLLTYLANMAALAIHNRQMYDALRTQS